MPLAVASQYPMRAADLLCRHVEPVSDTAAEADRRRYHAFITAQVRLTGRSMTSPSSWRCPGVDRTEGT
jgi:hypothetical protein